MIELLQNNGTVIDESPYLIEPLFQAMDSILSYLPVILLGFLGVAVFWSLFKKFIK